MDENVVILRKIEERYQRFLDYYVPMESDFLSPEEQRAACALLRSLGANEAKGVFLYGGYEEAERKQVVFLPDYLGVATEEELHGLWCREPEICPLAVLNVTVPAQEKRKPGHRDYLGALMAEGIVRAKVGDILADESGAQIIIAKELGEYLQRNFTRVGSVEVRTELVSLGNLRRREEKAVQETFTVSSPRADNIVSAGFGISRKLAAEAIACGKVFVEGREISKPDLHLRGGEKIVLRGRGKLVYVGESGTSRKGRVYVTVKRYV